MTKCRNLNERRKKEPRLDCPLSKSNKTKKCIKRTLTGCVEFCCGVSIHQQNVSHKDKQTDQQTHTHTQTHKDTNSHKHTKHKMSYHPVKSNGIFTNCLNIVFVPEQQFYQILSNIMLISLILSDCFTLLIYYFFSFIKLSSYLENIQFLLCAIF